MTIAELLIIHNKLSDVQGKAEALSFKNPIVSGNEKTFLFSDGSKLKFNQMHGTFKVC